MLKSDTKTKLRSGDKKKMVQTKWLQVHEQSEVGKIKKCGTKGDNLHWYGNIRN